MSDDLERFDEGLGGVERIVSRGKNRVDGELFSLSTHNKLTSRLGGGLSRYGSCLSRPGVPRVGYYGTTKPIRREDARFLSITQTCSKSAPVDRDPADKQNAITTEPFLIATHNLIAHAQAHRAVIKLRDQKQLDFEELSAYLSAIVSERDRLAALQTGHSGAPVGLTTYLRDQVDKLRGTDDIHTRRERMRKLDIKIKEVGSSSLCTGERG
jgi:sorting nexin-4